MENKRRNPRIEIAFPVKLLQLDKDEDESGSAYDISFEGICLATSKELPLNVPVELLLKIPEGKPVVVRGKVAWSKRISGNKYRFGVNLDGVEPACLARALRQKLR